MYVYDPYVVCTFSFFSWYFLTADSKIDELMDEEPSQDVQPLGDVAAPFQTSLQGQGILGSVWFQLKNCFCDAVLLKLIVGYDSGSFCNFVIEISMVSFFSSSFVAAVSV